MECNQKDVRLTKYGSLEPDKNRGNMKELPYYWYYTTRGSISTMKGFITMNSDTMKIDIDCLMRMIYGANDLLDSLNHADFQVRLKDALTGDKQKRFEFLDSSYGFLVGSIQTLSGAVQILADGLLNGDIDINYVKLNKANI